MCFHFERNQERTFDKIGRAMARMHPSLTFEFGPVEGDKREFVISADGDREAFPSVESLFASAPALSRWTFIKFRPRRVPMPIGFDDFRLSPADLEVSLTPDGGKVGLTVYIRGYDESLQDEFLGPAFILLDWTLGEYDMETEVGSIDFQPFERDEGAERHNLDRLPAAFDRLLGR